MTGRTRRLLAEYDAVCRSFDRRNDISVKVVSRNWEGAPNGYAVTYKIRSICGVENIEELGRAENPPLYADSFVMDINIPDGYPDVDAPAEFRFRTDVPHPWHPNIRYFGEMAGRVCLNATDTFLGIEWGINRVASYLHYERYHALNEPPFPEDQQVAAWVVRQGEKNGWIYL